jgi:hypothetical protein
MGCFSDLCYFFPDFPFTKNPEIASISTVLLQALTDPADNTVSALEELIQTEFLHAIDPPSLALIFPILHRGLRDRLGSTKRYSALVSTLYRHRDIVSSLRQARNLRLFFAVREV